MLISCLYNVYDKYSSYSFALHLSLSLIIPPPKKKVIAFSISIPQQSIQYYESIGYLFIRIMDSIPFVLASAFVACFFFFFLTYLLSFVEELNVHQQQEQQRHIVFSNKKKNTKRSIIIIYARYTDAVNLCLNMYDCVYSIISTPI